MANALARAAAIAQAAWREERLRPTAPRRRRHELEFLPAAIEVLETPASPLGHLTLWLILAFFVVALAWSFIAHVDVVATAQGRIVPAGRSKVVQPLDTGVVKAIHVEDGQAVKAGEVLIELDTTSTAADQARLRGELVAAEIEAARLKAALAGSEATGVFTAPPGASAALVETNLALLLSQLAEYKAKLAGIDEDIAQKKADRAGAEAGITKLEKTLPLVREQADARANLAARGYYSRLSALQDQERVIEHEQDLTTSKFKRDQITANIEALQRQRNQVEAEFHKTVLEKLAEAEKHISMAQQDLIKANERNALQSLTAPIDGVVQQLAAHTVGGVVTPAQPLLVVVPNDAPLEAEVMILNQDIGFIRPGQAAAIKLETFPFTKYGTIQGTVTSVSHDAVADTGPAPARNPGQAGEQAQSPGAKPTLVYPARIALTQTSLDVDGHATPLGPGMVVSADVKTDQRRVIDYLLSPILRYRHEALHER
jgi:hemolysin D